MDTFIAHPEGRGPFPAVVVYMDFWGFREELFDVVRRVASVGYYTIMPNLYHRQGKVRTAFYDEGGKMISLEALDEARAKIALAPLNNLSNAMVMRDTKALLQFMYEGNEPVRRGAIGSIGYCMGDATSCAPRESFPIFSAPVPVCTVPTSFSTKKTRRITLRANSVASSTAVMPKLTHMPGRKRYGA